jgi:hypothetical protein
MKTCQRCFFPESPDDAAVCANSNCAAPFPVRTAPAPMPAAPREPRQLVRATDPATSYGGAVAAVAKLGETQRRTVDAVRAHPGLTARELAQAVGDADPRDINRRLNEVESAGLVVRRGPRPCSITNKPCSTWWPKEDA